MCKRGLQIFMCFIVIVVFSTPLSATETSIDKNKLQNEVEKIQQESDGEPKSYPIIVEYYDESTGQTHEKTIYFTIEGDNTNFNGDEVINANNASISPFDVQQFKNQDWIELTAAKAWNKTNNNPIEIVSVDVSKIKSIEGSYPITFSTANGTTALATITVTLTALNTMQPNNIYTETTEEMFLRQMTTFILIGFWMLILIIPLLMLFFQYYKIRSFVRDVYKLIKENN